MAGAAAREIRCGKDRGSSTGCSIRCQVVLLLRFAIAKALLSNVSSAIFCARLTSPVATPSGPPPAIA
jgi:hypothetical protein